MPQAGRTEALRPVIARHSPSGPARTSGGVPKPERMTAEVWPSAAIAASTLQPPVETVSGPRQAVVICLVAVSRRWMAVSPPMIVPTRISLPRTQRSELAEDLTPGVRFSAAPPAAGTV